MNEKQREVSVKLTKSLIKLVSTTVDTVMVLLSLAFLSLVLGVSASLVISVLFAVATVIIIVALAVLLFMPKDVPVCIDTVDKMNSKVKKFFVKSLLE